MMLVSSATPSIVDFLPFKCDACAQVFCLDHRSHTAHSCTNAGFNDVSYHSLPYQSVVSLQNWVPWERLTPTVHQGKARLRRPLPIAFLWVKGVWKDTISRSLSCLLYPYRTPPASLVPGFPFSRRRCLGSETARVAHDHHQKNKQKRALECSKCNKVLRRPPGVEHSLLLQRHLVSGCVDGVRKARPNKIRCSLQGCRGSEFVKVREI